MKIDVERLIDLVCEENTGYTDYVLTTKRYKKSYDPKLKDKVSWLSDRNFTNQCATRAACEILGMNKGNIDRLYSATRAVERWRKKTNYEKLISSDMADKLIEYIFGDDGKLWLWYERREFRWYR